MHVVLPIGTFAETSGTFVNVEGRWQSWAGATKLPGEARPGWKVLRVLANLLNLQGFDYDSSEEIRDALRTICGDGATAETRGELAGGVPAGPAPSGAWVDMPPYQIDVLVRGSERVRKNQGRARARAVI